MLSIRMWSRSLHTSVAGCSSALYITGKRASDTCVILVPHIDFEDRLKNISALKQSVESRGLDIDVEKLKESWDFLKSVKETKQQLERRREETARKIKELLKRNNKESEDEMKPLKIVGKMLRENLKTITSEAWDLEENVIGQVLSLPNDVHCTTPFTTQIFEEYGERPSSVSSPSHIEMGRQRKLLTFFTPTCYYLEDDAALWEIKLLQFCSSFFARHDFVPTSNCDFAKSLIVEGCGSNHLNPSCVFILQQPKIKTVENDDNLVGLHLVGGTSIASFAALFAKHEIVFKNKMCLKLCAVGRRYSPPSQESSLPGLLNVAQESTAEIFIATRNCETDLMEHFSKGVNSMIDFYKTLGIHFRVVQCEAKSLKHWESCRTAVEMFSCHLGEYVEVGHVSLCGTYISKRLLMKYQENTKHDFLNVVVGRIVSVPRITACLLEQGSLKSCLEKVTAYMSGAGNVGNVLN